MSLNHHTPSEICTVKYNDLDHAIRNCLKIQSGKSDAEILGTWNHIASNVTDQIFFAKSDLKSAFRILPILPSQRCYLIMAARNPKNGSWGVFVDKCLPFGGSVSCARFQLFSDSLKHAVECITGRYFAVTNYLDDFLFVADEEEICNKMVRKFLDMCNTIGCPVALEKTEWANNWVIFLGILLDGKNKTLAIPEEKRIKALNLLDWAICKKKVTIKFVQRITGVLNFINRAIVPGRAFTRGMYEKLKLRDNSGKLLKQFHHTSLGSDFLQDCEVWKEFLQDKHNQALYRPFVDIDCFSSATTLNFYTDSSLNKTLGMGGIFMDMWFQERWHIGFVQTCNPSIQYLELLALVAGVVTWGKHPQMCNNRLVVFCDNMSVRDMVNSYATSCFRCRKLLRILTLDNLRYNRRVFVKYVTSKNNLLADALSRFEMNKFWSKAPGTMNRTKSELSSKVWPIDKIW